MKKLSLLSLTFLLMLICTLYGCKKADGKEEQTVRETDNTAEAADNSAEDQEDSPVVTEDITDEPKEAGIEEAQAEDVQPIEAVPTLSWKLAKEIKPSEKGMKSRLVGFLNDTLGISTYREGVLYYTTDGGETWTSGKNSSACIAGLEMIDEKNAFLAANYSQARVSKDGGVTWDKLPDFGNMRYEHCRYLSFIDENTGWIANRREVGFTTDGGQSWESIQVPENMTDISAIWLKSKTEGFLLTVDGILFTTKDGGAAWTEKDLGIAYLNILVCPTAAFHVVDEQTFQIVVYLENGADNGYYYLTTKDGGNTIQYELIEKGGPGYINLNREGTILTTTDDKDATIRVYNFTE